MRIRTLTTATFRMSGGGQSERSLDGSIAKYRWLRLWNSSLQSSVINNFIPLVDSRGGQKEKNNGDYKTYRTR